MSQSANIATNRTESLFKPDLVAAENDIRAAVTGKRILAVGAAGSIGSSTVHVISRYRPQSLHIIDQNENALAELVRQLRSAPEPLNIPDFQTSPLDYGALATQRFMAENGPYDLVMNFAAIKHVRTEKDAFGILQMLDTNIVKQARFRRWIANLSPKADYFSVSTDKAANPVSFMGATKRVMEHVLFDGAREAGLTGRITTARFANVAFSNGSLLQSFENRMQRGEPIACPVGIRRYFVSLEEAGEICTLANIVPPHAHIAIPRLDPESCLVPLTRIAEAFIRENGFEPEPMEDEREACRSVNVLRRDGRWPLLLTPSNTAGEKPYEEFVGQNEKTVEIGLTNILAVPYAGLSHGGSVDDVIRQIETTLLETDQREWDKDSLKAMIGRLEPSFMSTHIESANNLDQRA